MTPEEALEKHPGWRKFDEVLRGVGYERSRAVRGSKVDAFEYSRRSLPATHDGVDVVLWADGEHWAWDPHNDTHTFTDVLSMLTALREAHGA